MPTAGGEEEELHPEAEQEQLEGDEDSVMEEQEQQLDWLEEGEVSEEHGEPGSDSGGAAAAKQLPPTRYVPPAATRPHHHPKGTLSLCSLSCAGLGGGSASRIVNTPTTLSRRAMTTRPARLRNHGAGGPALHDCALFSSCVSST